MLKESTSFFSAAIFVAAMAPILPAQVAKPRETLALSTLRTDQRAAVIVPAGSGQGTSNVDLLWPLIAPGPVRYQQWFHNGLFPQGKLRITGMAFRPNPQLGGKMDIADPSMLIRFSTTTNSTNAVGQRFADNLSADIATVRSGKLTFSSSFTQLENGTMDFDVLVPFDAPFEFDTTTGRHLILDMFNEFGTSVENVNPQCLVFPVDAPRGCNLDAQAFENPETAMLRRWRSDAGTGTLAENAVAEVSDTRGYVIRFEYELVPTPASGSVRRIDPRSRP